MKFQTLALSACMASALVASPAAAATLTGQTVGIQYLFPDQNTVGSAGGGTGQFVVGNSEETNVGGILAVNVMENSVTLTATSDYSLTASDFQGIRISDALGAFGDFSNLNIEGSTFDSVAASFDADNLFFNFIDDTDGTVVAGSTLSATFDIAAVPVPAAGFLMLAGLGMLGAVRGRAGRKS